MSLYKTKPQTISIKLYYREVSTTAGFSKVVIEKDEKKAEQELKDQQKKIEEQGIAIADNDKIYCLTTKWKVLTWQEQNQITEQSSYYNDIEGYQDVNVWRFRDLRLKQCLVDWDMKDEHNNNIPLDPSVVDQLPSDVVLYLLNQYDESISGKVEDKKK